MAGSKRIWKASEIRAKALTASDKELAEMNLAEREHRINFKE